MIKASGYAPKRAGQKLMVTVPSSDKLAQSAERALRMRQVGCRDVWELALVLAPLCAELAARRINADELAALERNTLARTREAVGAGASPVQKTIEFQAGVAKASRNQALILARGPVSLLMRAGYATMAAEPSHSPACACCRRMRSSTMRWRKAALWQR